MRFDDLERALTTAPLAPRWLVTGEEPLLMIEAADAIRAAAHAAGYVEREVLNATANWNWAQVVDTCQSVGLFTSQKLVELRMASFRPGTKGTQILPLLSTMPLDGIILLITVPYDWSLKRAKWFQALSANSQVVECAQVTEKDLPRWFTKRIAKQQQSLEPDALSLLCERCEGNLLAARQELLKLSYQYPAGTRISAEMIREAVSDVSRFDAKNLMDATFTGDAAKASRVVASLKAEGVPIPSFLWMLTDEIRLACRAKSLMESGTPLAAALKQAGVWGDRGPRISRACNRLSSRKLANALLLAGDIDRIAKGLVVRTRDSDPWMELDSLATFLAR